MPRAKPVIPRPFRTAARSRTRTVVKRKAPTRNLNGIPLKLKVLWVYDTDSPQFKAIWQKERAALRRSVADPDLEEFLDDAWRDLDRSMNSR
jgi:Protein  of unknown function (DUF3018)